MLIGICAHENYFTSHRIRSMSGVAQFWPPSGITTMKFPYDLRFKVRGFSAKRMAYLLVSISAFLIPFHWRADYHGDTYLAAIALAAMVVALALGFYIPRTDRHRFLPFVLGFAFLVIHSLLQKL